jgi:hypothetical protein
MLNDSADDDGGGVDALSRSALYRMEVRGGVKAVLMVRGTIFHPTSDSLARQTQLIPAWVNIVHLTSIDNPKLRELIISGSGRQQTTLSEFFGA